MRFLWLCALAILMCVGCRGVIGARLPKVQPIVGYQQFLKLDEIAVRLDSFRETSGGKLPRSFEDLNMAEDEQIRVFINPINGSRLTWLYLPDSEDDVLVASPVPLLADALAPLKLKQGKYRCVLRRNLTSAIISETSFLKSLPSKAPNSVKR